MDPVALTAVMDSPAAMMSTSESPALSPSSTLTPAYRRTKPLPVPAMPVRTVSRVMVPLVACRLMSPPLLLMVRVDAMPFALSCDMVMLRPANKSMVLGLKLAVISAFCKISWLAFRLMCPLELITSALSVRLLVALAGAAPACSRMLPKACTAKVPASTSPSFTVRLPASVNKTSAPPDTKSDWAAASVLSVTAAVLPTRWVKTVATLSTAMSVDSVMNIPPEPALPLSVATSTSRWLALSPAARVAVRRRALA